MTDLNGDGSPTKQPCIDTVAEDSEHPVSDKVGRPAQWRHTSGAQNVINSPATYDTEHHRGQVSEEQEAASSVPRNSSTPSIQPAVNSTNCTEQLSTVREEAQRHNAEHDPVTCPTPDSASDPLPTTPSIAHINSVPVSNERSQYCPPPPVQSTQQSLQPTVPAQSPGIAQPHGPVTVNHVPILPASSSVQFTNSEQQMQQAQRSTISHHDSDVRLSQQRKYMNNVREPVLKLILPHLREAVASLTAAQKIAGDNVRLHLFAEHQTDLQRTTSETGFIHNSNIAFYTFFSKTFYADTDYKHSLVRDIANIFAKFNVMHSPEYATSPHPNNTLSHYIHSHAPGDDNMSHNPPSAVANHPSLATQPVTHQPNLRQDDHMVTRPLTQSAPERVPERIVPSPHPAFPTSSQQHILTVPALHNTTIDPPSTQSPCVTGSTDPSVRCAVQNSASAQMQAKQQDKQRTAPSAPPIPADIHPNTPVTTTHLVTPKPNASKPDEHHIAVPSQPVHVSEEQVTDVDPYHDVQPHDTWSQPAKRGKTKTSAIPIQQILPDSVPLTIPSWFPFNTKRDNNLASPQNTISPNEAFKKDTTNGSDDDSDSNVIVDRLISQLAHKRLPMLTVDTTPFNDLTLVHVKFIYRRLFEAGFHRYIEQQPSKRKGILQSSFSYSSFTPPWFPDTIHCMANDVFYDLPKRQLPHLQALRNGSSSSRLSLILAAFRLKEPEFAGPAIDYLISNYKSHSPSSSLFKPPTRSRKAKRRLPQLPSSGGTPSTSQTNPVDAPVKRPRSSSSSPTSTRKHSGDSNSIQRRTQGIHRSRVAFLPLSLPPELPPALPPASQPESATDGPQHQ